VKPTIDLDYPRKDGTTLRKHLTQLKKWDLIEEASPVVPSMAEHLWEWFWDVISGKGGEEGFWMSLKAWSEMTGTKPTVWEVGVLQQLHGEYQRQISAKLREG